MKIYLVGGAVRDKLLGREITERDYVVVGATPDEMLALGFRPVGKDFPVFLHPDTSEEYALARTERKTGKGYTGFDCIADPTVTLTQDLRRRDLRINAMAIDINDPHEKIIDPYLGQEDIANRTLRHITDSFKEDPVRILRVARFAARFTEFSVHEATNALMIDMVNNGEVDALVPERVWKELSRALIEEAPICFFKVLEKCEALPKLMPELNLKDHIAPTPRTDWHEALINITKQSKHGHTRFAALVLHLDYDKTKKLCERLRPPKQYSDLAEMVAKYSSEYVKIDFSNAEKVISFLEHLDAYRRSERFFDFCEVAQLKQTKQEPMRAPIIVAESTNEVKLKQALELTSKIDAQVFIKQGLKGDQIMSAIHNARVEILKNQSGNSSGPHITGARPYS
ncbi:MAG: multifunctional CCA tRNA nucleotidyl transferase/2'3'-cyclic phosphodiesterase/2'nucleotidase/phosphatase [Pseudomonadota bacterium]|nr:multifunctional CCA tRNA nucleotidyl transferase/2'3'-cyclic phosphodiesterase/2'nucleotidase/phosphatase [Pseudomonadota bacterium]